MRNKEQAASKERVAKEFATDKPEQKGDAALRVIQENVSNSNPQVRRHATAALSRVIFASRMPRDLRKQYGVTVTNEAVLALLPDVVPLLNDSDDEVRTNVMRTIGLSCYRSETIERAITSRYDREPLARIRAMMVFYLAFTRAMDARSFVTKGLKDGDALVRGWAADALRYLRPVPTELLSRVLDAYARESQSFAKDKYISVLAAHGKEVAGHLPKLRKLLHSEGNISRRAAIAQAIYFAESDKSTTIFPHAREE